MAGKISESNETDPIAALEPGESVPPREQPDYVLATEDLYVGQVRAHTAGDLVPTVNVDKNGWKGKTQPA